MIVCKLVSFVKPRLHQLKALDAEKCKYQEALLCMYLRDFPKGKLNKAAKPNYL
jgi:hypothetical protein